MNRKLLFSIIIIIAVSLVFPCSIRAQDVLGQETQFNIESSYDLSQRNEISAVLIETSLSAYWYMDKAFWDGLNIEQQKEVRQSLASLLGEFETTIYPTLTKTFGSEWNPGIDKDTRVTVLIHPMKKESGGYTDTSDEYPKTQIPESNEREMVYLNSQYINTANARVFLAHELVHLITFNQKNKLYGLSEDTWLNEARAEYSATLLGYNADYEKSNLQKRVQDFLDKPSDSLTEWRETAADYGVVNLFTQYLVDHYGSGILSDSLKLRQTGIQSLNSILSHQGFKEDFAQIFTNWVITLLINNCEISEKYCYFNQNLKDFRVTPLINYLPFIGESTLSVTNTTKDWAGNWHKFIGGKGTLKLEFNGTGGGNFQVPYIIQKASGETVLGNLLLSQSLSGEILVADFGTENVALIIMPIAQNKTTGFSGLEPSRTFFWSASTQQEKEIILPSLSPLSKPISQMTRAEILARIAEIQAVISQLQQILSQLEGQTSCPAITKDLYLGLKDDAQVRCLQEFLKLQGVAIYPEGLVTGNFGNLTQLAVIRFQEKYNIQGTGFVGIITRAKINDLLTK